MFSAAAPDKGREIYKDLEIGLEESSVGPSSRGRFDVAASPDFRDDLGETDPLMSIDDLTGAAGIPLGPPPEFTSYQAEAFEVGYGDVVSHDPHLNTDGEALYRFLLEQSVTPPVLRMHCRGVHIETQSKWVTQTQGSGQSERFVSQRQTSTETVVDFDFCIDIRTHPGVAPVQWSVPDSEPAYRGLMVRELEEGAGTGKERRHAHRAEVKAQRRLKEKQILLGLPPWVTAEGKMDSTYEDMNTLQSANTLRQWADEYCASPKLLKEFVYDKAIYGWNLQSLEIYFRALVDGVYRGVVTVDFKPCGSKIYIRSDNKLSRMLSNKWLKFLSIILFLFPFIWLFKRFHSLGGGVWAVCGGAFPLRGWVPTDDMPERNEFEPTPPFEAVNSDSIPVQTMPNHILTIHGPRKRIGLLEWEWMAQWHNTILKLTRGRYQSSIPLVEPLLNEDSTITRSIFAS